MKAIGAQDAHSTRSDGSAPDSAEALVRRDVLFRRAGRHTLLVRALRVLFPLGMVLCFGYYAVVLIARQALGPGTLMPGKIELTDDDLKMKNPSYFGVTGDNGKYIVHAREAIVDIAMTGPIKLETIDGDLVQMSGVKTNLKSTRGTLDNKLGILELFDGVDITTSDGTIAHLISATVKTKDHYVLSRQPLVADMPTGRLTANSMDYWSEKKVAHFDRDVTLRLVQQPDASGAQPALGLGGDGRQPVDIASRSLDVDDLRSTADFHGQVVATQGETQLRSPYMHVDYEGHATADPSAAAAAPAVPPGPPGSGAQVRHIQAYPNIVLTAGTDRRLLADKVDFDVKSDTALFTGNVELTQAKNVFHGTRLAVDRKTGKSRLDAPPAAPRAPPGRITALLIQTPDPAKPPPPPAKPQKGAQASAQAGAGQSSLGVFQADPNVPTDIEADVLDVNDQAKQAIFRGHVIAKQGDYTVTSAELVATYAGQTGLLAPSGGESGAAPAPNPASGTAGPGGAQITHLETKGGTKIVTTDGREAEGMTAHFDLKANTLMMEGGAAGVTLHQGQTHTHGSKLHMNLTSGEAHVDNPQGTGGLAPTAAQLSIAGKAGQAPPAQPTDCPLTGQSCMIFYPEQMRQATEVDKSKQQPAATAKPAPRAADPQVSPSAVYRSN